MLDSREFLVAIGTIYTRSPSTRLHGVKNNDFILLTSAELTYINPWQNSDRKKAEHVYF